MKELEPAVAAGLAAEADHGAAAHADVARGSVADGAPTEPAHTHGTCLNCDATLYGRYCQDCGQSSDDHHRSIVHLMWEAVEGFTHLDGRLAKTLPALLFAPGRLARDHIEGRRMRHVPPFRLFLITLLVFMFAAETVVKGGGHTITEHGHATTSRQTYEVDGQKVVVLHAADLRNIKHTLGRTDLHGPLERWLVSHVSRAAANREFYLMLVFQWAHRLAILMLPILAGLLTLLYVYKRRFYVYDHLVVSMQYLSFCFLLWAAVWVLPSPVRSWLMAPAIAWTPFNLYLILRTAYGSGRIGAGVKALSVWVATVALFGGLTVGLLVFALDRV